MDERAAERQQQKTIVLADDRRMADRAMKSCDRVLNAHAILDDDPQRFAVLINALTADQTEWRQRYDDNRRANKRVSVKSDVVGNHLYQTARDWTWARLIEDGKALLTIDPDQPTRILSTDKKAQKAGGLCLALKGVPVKPTDDVDVEKEYQAHPNRQSINIIIYINKLNFQVMFKTRFISMLVLLAAVATGAVAQTTYKVSVKEGTEDATNWTITPPEATTTGVAQGTTVTATYNGTKKVKSVKAKKKAAVAAPTLTLGEMTQGGDPLNNGSGSETYFSPTFSEGQQVAVFYKNTSGQTVKVLSDALTASDISNEGKSATINVTIDDADKTQPVTYFYPATMAKDDGSINFNFKAQSGTEASLSTVRNCCKGSGAWDGNALPSVSMASQIAIWKAHDDICEW